LLHCVLLWDISYMRNGREFGWIPYHFRVELKLVILHTTV